jgi:Cytochrome P450
VAYEPKEHQVTCGKSSNALTPISYFLTPHAIYRWAVAVFSTRKFPTQIKTALQPDTRIPNSMESKIGIPEVFVLLVAVYGLYKYWTRDPRLSQLPPHVRGWPIINQTLAQMQDDVIPLVQGWAKEYGEVFRTTSGTTTFIWLNSRKSVKELIDRRSVIYSSRHPQPMVERAGGGKRMVFMPYGKDWRAIRNIVHRVHLMNFITDN